ncbi:MAG: hypothetical protein ACKVH8_15990 [Pirellulales bacterium]
MNKDSSALRHYIDAKYGKQMGKVFSKEAARDITYALDMDDGDGWFN